MIVNKILLIFAVFFFGCSLPISIGKLKTILLYKNFLKQGSTNNTRNAFDFPQNNNVDKSINSKYFVDNQIFENLIKTAKVKKHSQQKLARITVAGEFIENNKKHYFVYFKSARLIIDFSEMKNYWLKDSLNLQQR